MRLFIGLPLHDDLKKNLQDAWQPFAEKFKYRAIPPELWHMTIAFLDDVPEQKLPALAELIGSALKTTPSGIWTFTRFETFPAKKLANITAHAEPENSEAWKKFIDSLRDVVSLVAPGIDRKPWHPHVTIGKAPKNARLPAWNEGIEPLVWQPDILALVHSTLTAQGPIYRHSHEFKLRV
ncbi:MAG: RNA 2',3'-cyclic phosphodiesterase [Patescibacteria group bacterium]